MTGQRQANAWSKKGQRGVKEGPTRVKEGSERGQGRVNDVSMKISEGSMMGEGGPWNGQQGVNERGQGRVNDGSKHGPWRVKADPKKGQ